MICSSMLRHRRCLVLGLLAGLGGCAVPERAAGPTLYDFGVSRSAATQAPARPTAAHLPALALTLQASSALDATVIHYRLGYADDQQLRAYTLARWTMPPGELVQQRVREGLSRHYTVLRPGEGAQRLLQLELEEFSQVFEAPAQSSGLVRWRATLRQRQATGERLLAQRSFVVQRPAPSADAAGGVRALGAAVDAAVTELVQWLAQTH